MKTIKKYFFPGMVALAVAMMARTAFGDDAIPTVPTDQFLAQLWVFVGQSKGATTMAVVAGVLQLTMLFFKTSLSNFAGKYRLLILLFLTVAATITGLMSQGMTLAAALVNGATLAAVQVFIHQIYKQFFVKKA